MPEIKNQFTGGKMNKDVDERLVPKGEYRDAMNIQVSTSEGSDVGTVQNILGNSAVISDLGINSGSICVGAIADEKNDALYWFMREPFSAYNLTVSRSRDIIFELKSGDVQPVFVDMKSISIAVDALQAPSSGDIIINSQAGFDVISVGDTFQLFANGGNLSGLEFYTVLSKDQGTLSINIGDYTNASWANYQAGDPGELQIVLNTGGGVLKFPSKIITGINIVDDMLFWTDGITEPKKINIPRSIAGTPSGNFHTRLINLDQNIAYGDNILTQEEHITVIRKAPKHVLDVKTETTDDDFAFGVTPVVATPPQPVFLLNTTLLTPGMEKEIYLIENVNSTTPVIVGDTILFNPSSEANLPNADYQVAGQVVEVYNNQPNAVLGQDPSGANVILLSGEYEYVKIEITSIDTAITTLAVEYNWAVQVDKGRKFKNNFLRFSYRYKYKDGEYSTFAPFTNVIFKSGEFKYDVKEAYNLGMENEITKIVLSNYTSNLPKDVDSIDLLYKESNSPVIYLIDTINKDTLQKMLSKTDEYEVKPNQTKAILPENQLLRAWDNVPRSSLAQDITGNRIVYGNYLQNYNLLNASQVAVKASLANRDNCSVDSTPLGSINSGQKSLKSIRNYSLGLSYLDEYGRQTPVFTGKQGELEIPISRSKDKNQIESQVVGIAPDWATHYKIFIKETSNEYYNLAMDRVYDARDGNIWLSFPSSDRNKVDEETFLILKKGVDGNSAIDERNKYKILAIENEAPTFIKSKIDFLGESISNGANSDIFPYTSFMPFEDKKTVKVNLANWDSTEIPLTDIKDDILVEFAKVGATNKIVSQKYEVLTLEPDNVNSIPEAYVLGLDEPIRTADNFMPSATTPTNVDETGTFRVYRKTLKDSPEFDGRFFVKVKRDMLVVDEVMPGVLTQDEVVPTITVPFYYLADTNSIAPTATTPAVTGQNNSNDYDAWKDNLKFGGSSITSSWFIDAAYYRAGFKGVDVRELGLGITGLYQNFDYPGLAFHSSMQDEGYNKGIWTDFTTGKHYIDLSYSRVLPHVRDGGWNATAIDAAEDYFNGGFNNGLKGLMGIVQGLGAFDNIDSNYANPTGKQWDKNKFGGFDVGSSTYNPDEQDQLEIVQMLAEGQQFRFTGDPDEFIYTIRDVEKLYFTNGFGATYIGHDSNATSNGITSTSDFGGSSGNEGCFVLPNSFGYGSGDVSAWKTTCAKPFVESLIKYGKSYNRRTTYRIEISENPVTRPGATFNPIEAGQADATNDGSLEFVELHYTGTDGQLSSPNPAIWETEPKEDIDLDIYYEVDGYFPVRLQGDMGNDFAPIGSVVTSTSSNINFAPADDVTVVGWEDNVVELSVLASNNNSNTNSNGELVFHRSDGSCVRASLNFLDDGTGNATLFSYKANLNQNVLKQPVNLSWFNCYSFGNGVESDRIRDDYNQLRIDKGAKASSTVSKPYKEEYRKYGLIYSGLYNSISGVNNLNQFIAAEKITKDINPIYGSIQKLHAGWGQGGDLVTLCEDRVLKILANKDALFNADGNANVTSTNNVLGQAIPYSGQYGISKNPESFASDAYRIYFTDKVRGTVMRLSMDGLTPISNHGMKDWFRDNLKLNNTILGSYDDKKDEYNVTLQQTDDAKRNNNPVTISFREDVKGWVSFKSFTPENAISCANEYYTFKNANIWKHHDESVNRNTFYNEGHSNSTLNVILNDIPGSVKSFNTINYEGSQSRVVPNLQDNQYYNLASKPGWYVDSVFTNKESGSLEEFIEKEGKWFNYIKGKEIQHSGSSIIVNPDGSSSFDQASFAIQGLGILGGDPTGGFVYGCTDPVAFNYNPNATADDGSCEPVVYGCLEATADNLCNNNCNTDNGSCQWSGCCCQGQSFPDGCTNVNLFTEALAYELLYNLTYSAISCDDSSCFANILGCTDSTAFNYNSSANVDDGSCIAVYGGCMEPTANENYDSLANTEDGTCIWRGCTDDTTPANNYLWEGSTVDNLATSQGWNYAVLEGGGNATNGYFPANSTYGIQNTNSTICTYDEGCMDTFADNFDAGATEDDGSCEYCGEWVEYGAFGSPNYGITITHETYQGYDDGTIEISMPSGTSIPPAAPGYTVMLLQSGGYPAPNSSGAIAYINSSYTTAYFYGVPPGEYYFQVTQGQGEFVGNQYTACSFNSHTSGVGVYGMDVNVGPNPNGCTDSTACNYNAIAIVDDGSCILPGCDDINAIDGDPALGGCGCTAGDTSCCTYAPQPIQGCTDDGSGGGPYAGIAACNYNPLATSDDGTCNYTSCAGCLDDRLNNAKTSIAASNYDATKTIHDQSQCVYNYGTVVYDGNTGANDTSNFIPESMSTILSGPLAGNNFIGNNSNSSNWTDDGLGGIAKTFVAAVFDVSNAPPIRFPGYNAGGVYAPSQTSSRETQFSWNMPGYTSDWPNGVAGDITTYYGFSTTSPTLDWMYSNDNGDNWVSGTGWNSSIPVKLVKFYMFMSADESSGVLDWGQQNHPYGYSGKIYQNAKFGFTDFTWNGNPIPLNDDGACAGNNSCPDFHVIETSESKTIITGCVHAGYCNTSGDYTYPSNANWPTHATNNPCGGTPGCTYAAACNYNQSADCNDGSCTSPTTWYYHSSNWTCGGSAPASGCYGLNVCTVNGTCRGQAWQYNVDCQSDNCTGVTGCTTVGACNYDATATCDDGSCYWGGPCPQNTPGYSCNASTGGCYQAPGGCGGCGTYTLDDYTDPQAACEANCGNPI